MSRYRSALEIVLELKREVMGEQAAAGRADQVSGLELDAEGGVRAVQGDAEAVFFALLRAYCEVEGRNGVYVVARELEEQGMPEIAEKARYWFLLEETINKQMKVLGRSEGVLPADAVDGLTVDQDGRVQGFEGDGKEMLDRLVEEYWERQGPVAAFLIARRLENVIVGDIDLPDSIGRRITRHSIEHG